MRASSLSCAVLFSCVASVAAFSRISTFSQRRVVGFGVEQRNFRSSGPTEFGAIKLKYGSTKMKSGSKRATQLQLQLGEATKKSKAQSADIEQNNSSHDASFWEKALVRFQIWALRHPNHIFSRSIMPVVAIVEGLVALSPSYLPSKRMAFGPNFCCAGEVVLGEFEKVERALTSPQARTFRLGTTRLDANHLPTMDSEPIGRNVFLLALSDSDSDGDGTHEAFRQAVVDFIISKSAQTRQTDKTAKRLLDQMAKDYEEMTHGEDGDFFKDDDRGLNAFFIRYMHYVLFGLDPDDADKMGLLSKLYYTSGVTAYWFTALGTILPIFKAEARGWPGMIEEAVKVYKESPALAEFPANEDKYLKMSKDELARAAVPLMGIAALIGPRSLARPSMGFAPLPAYEGHEETAKINVTEIWDGIDLQNRDELEKYLYEVGRLQTPVTSSHRVATQEFTTRIAGKEYTFPAGTQINIPIVLGMLDESFWGPSTYQFDHNRKNLCPFSMIFNSVGDKHAGRICPGKDITLTMLIDVLQRAGEVRRAKKGV